MRILTFYSFFVFGTAIGDESWHQEYHSYDEIRDFFLDLSIENPHTTIIEDGNLFALMVWYHFVEFFQSLILRSGVKLIKISRSITVCFKSIAVPTAWTGFRFLYVNL